MRGRGWAVGLWAALLTGILVAWSPQYWPVSVEITAVSILAACWLALARDIQLPRQAALVAPIGAFGFLQIAIHTTVLPQLTLGTATVWALGAGLFGVSADVLRERRVRRLFLELMMWSITVLGVIAMLQTYGMADKVFGIFPATEGGAGTLLSKNQFAAMMEIGAPIALWYTLDRNPVPGGLCYAMILAATFTAASRAGVILVGVELVAFVVIVLLARRREVKAYVTVLAGLALLIAAASVIAGTDQIKARFQDKNPYEVRRELLDSTLRLIAERPMTGYGMGTWRQIYPKQATMDMALLANEAHNDWAQWTSEGGIPFVLLMAGVVAWIARPSVESIWGLGVLSVMAHSYVDYPTREPALLFLWFAMAGAVTQFRSGAEAHKRAKSEDL